MRSCWAWLALAACTHQVIVATPQDIANKGGDFAARGHARVFMMPTPRELSLDDRVTAQLEVSPGAPARISIGELLDACPKRAFVVDAATRAEYPHCTLLTATRPVVVADESHVDGDKVTGVATSVAALAAQAALIACAVDCRRPYDFVSDGVLVVEAAALTLALAAVFQYAKRD